MVLNLFLNLLQICIL